MRTFAIASLTIALSLSYCAKITANDRLPVMLAETYNNQIVQDKEYLLSEKYDGIRALWTGKELLTRNGNKIGAPAWFTESLPDFPLDGELWAGYGHFDHVQSVIHSQTTPPQTWHSIQYRVFDCPINQLDFKHRYHSLISWYHSQTQPPHIRLVRHYLVRSQNEIEQKLRSVLDKGGEGVILRDPARQYINGRDDRMLKVKPFQDDEATVVGYRTGKGKYSGMLGALIVKDKQNRIFAIGSGLDDHLRSHPPQIGEIITYRYQGMTNKGKPRFARFLRVRLNE